MTEKLPVSVPPPKPRSTRWGLLAVVLLFCATLFLCVQLQSAIDDMLRFPLVMGVVVLLSVLLVTWALGYTAFARRTRGILAIAALLIAPAAWVCSPWLSHASRALPRFFQIGSESPLEPPIIASGPGLAPVELSKTSAQDFPEFLGLGRRNFVNGIQLNPDWAAHPPKLLWRQPIGKGWSSFAIVNGFAITMEQRGWNEFTVCYEVATGRARWAHANQTRFSQSSDQGGEGPRATPTIAGGHVFVLGAKGILDCLDGATGSLIWSRNILADAGTANLAWGKSSSPLVVDDLVIVTGGVDKAPLLAYRQSTGAPVWRAGTDRADYSSPTLATLCGVRQIVQVNGNTVTGHDVSDGHIVWTYPWPGTDAKAPQPMPLDGDRVFLCAGYGIGSVMLHIQRDSSGALSAVELWKSPYLKSKFCNNAIYGQSAYGLDDGYLTCLDLSTGQRRWRGERYGEGQILLIDNLLLVVADTGEIVLVRASPGSFREIARIPALSGDSVANPALFGHRLLIRNAREAACFELP